MRILSFWAALLLFTLPVFSFAQESTFNFIEADIDIPAEKVADLSSYRTVRLDVAALYQKWMDTPGLLDLELRGAGQELDLHLAPYSQLKYDHRFTVMTEAGATTPEMGKTATYRGNVTGGGEAIFTFDEQFVLGSWTKDDRRMALQPLWRMWRDAPRDIYLIYNEADMSALPDACGTDVSNIIDDDTDDDHIYGTDKVGGGANKAVDECFEVDITLVADTEMYQDFNNNATSVINFMNGVLANVQTVYDDEFADELRYVVGTTIVYTTSNQDPYTNNTTGGTLLSSFTDISEANSAPLGTYDVATLWSGRNFAGSTVGVAWVGAICTRFRYNVLENFSSNATQLRNLWSHELGHNWSANHDNSGVWIMSPSVTFSDDWSPTSISAINDHISSRNCLASCVPTNPQQAPVAEAETAFPTICAEGTTVFYDLTEEDVTSRLWTFPGGTPGTSSEVAPEVFYPNPGNYTATLRTTNDVGTSTDQVTVSVTLDQPSGELVLFYEDFEDDNYSIIFNNPQNDALQWIVADTDGNLGNFAAVADNGTLDGTGTSDFLRTPVLDLTGYTSARFTMEYAYVRFDAQFRDQLRVIVIDNGIRNVVFLGDENGSGNFATGPDKSTTGGGLFTPETAEDWCFSGPACIDIDLTPFVGSDNIIVEVENDAGFGQPMWVDNLTVSTACNALASLPVEWLGFTAVPDGKIARLDWSVNQDEDHAGFTVERTEANSADWQDLGYLPATGGAAAGVHYSFSDPTVLGGTTYLYRLRQRDLDGTESFSDLRTVSFDGIAESGISAFPNPTTGQLQLRYAEGIEDYRLYNSLGALVRSGSLPRGGTTVQIGDLPAGVYVLRAGDDQVLRVVKR